MSLKVIFFCGEPKHYICSRIHDLGGDHSCRLHSSTTALHTSPGGFLWPKPPMRAAKAPGRPFSKAARAVSSLPCVGLIDKPSGSVDKVPGLLDKALGLVDKALGLPDKAQFSPVFLFRLSRSAGA